MKTKTDLLNEFENYGHEFFTDKLNENYKLNLIDGDCDFKTFAITIKIKEYKELFPFSPVVNFHYYNYFRCGCEYDCCGCLSSIDITTKKITDYITIIINYSFNY